MNIAVCGTGYVGLVTAAIFSSFGNQVWGIDIDKNKIENLKKGKVPFYETGLRELVLNGLKKRKLIFTHSFSQAIPQAQIVFICVGTPAKKNGDYDLSAVLSSAKEIAKNLKKYTVICIKSTVPPGTGQQVKEIIKKETAIPFDIASCPEFLREGSAVDDSLHPSRIVIGVDSNRAKDLLLELHKPIKGPRIICDLQSSQMIKYAANAFLATKISFINSIARLCDASGADILKVAEGLGLDPRIGKEFLNAGLGYGGSCFPKDTWALITFAKRLGYDFSFLREVDRVNQTQIDYLARKILKNCQGSLINKTITILGLAFKPGTDDLREATSLVLINKLLKLGAKINACDPVAIEKAKLLLKKVKFFDDPYQALKNSWALVLATDWPEYHHLDFKKIAPLMRQKLVIDGRNIFNPKILKSLGFVYQGIGRQ